jgi:tetratricopeptide (TPR) repeat protein
MTGKDALSEKELFDQAKSLFLKNKADEAEAILTQILEMNPGNPTALKNLTSIHLKQWPRLPQSQRQTLSEIHRLYDQGFQAYQAKNFIACLALFSKVHSLSQAISAAEHFARVTGEFIDEIELQLEVIENNRLIEETFREGLRLFDDARYEECIEKMMSVLSIDPGHEDAVHYITESTRKKNLAS